MLYLEERNYLANIISELKTLGILNLEGGGITMRLSDGNLLASPTGGAFRLWKVDPKDFLVTDINGKIIEKGNYLGMAEFPLDLRIMSNFPQANAVIHYHGPYSLAYASKCLPIPNTTNHVEVLGEIPCLKSPDETGLKREYLKNPYPVKIPEAVIQRPEVYVVFERLFKELDSKFIPRQKELEKHGLAFTIEKHGLFVFAKNLSEAIENSLRVEAAARTAIFSRLIDQ